MRIRMTLLVLLIVACSVHVKADGHRNLECFHIFYIDYDYNFIGYDYQCFETVTVTAGTVYIEPGGWWGPSPWETEHPPEFPPEEPPGGGGGAVANVTVTEAEITNDRVSVQLWGADGGAFVLDAIKTDGSSVRLVEEWRGAGTWNYSFQADSLAAGTYERVQGEWYIGDGVLASGSRAANFTVKGRWRHSEYATVWEDSCAQSPKEVGYLLDNTRDCTFSDPIDFNYRFPFMTWLNGSGISQGFGAMQQVWGRCKPNALDGQNNKFNAVGVIRGSCGDVDDSTVAQGVPDARTLPTHCGKSVFIVGVGVKTVSDSCPDCWHGGQEGQLDNYTSARLGNCARGSRDLGTFNTIFLDR